jgi:hypothetical protein
MFINNKYFIIGITDIQGHFHLMQNVCTYLQILR